MPIDLRCPSCEKRLRVRDDLAGSKLACPACRATLRIKQDAGAPPVPATAASASHRVGTTNSKGATQRMSLTCPCGQRLNLGTSLAGKLVKCPTCDNRLRVPEHTSAAKGPPLTDVAGPTIPFADDAYSERALRTSSPPPLPAALSPRDRHDDDSDDESSHDHASSPRRRVDRPSRRRRRKSTAIVGRIVGLSLAGVGFLAVAAVVIAVVWNRPFRVADTVFQGNETLAGFANLTFVFHKDGRAGMIDAHHPRENPVLGGWRQSGDKVTLSFRDCVYEGKMQDKTLSGQGQFVDGPQMGHRWNFTVTYAHDRGAGDIP